VALVDLLQLVDGAGGEALLLRPLVVRIFRVVVAQAAVFFF
jgi:hypothetical protein